MSGVSQYVGVFDRSSTTEEMIWMGLLDSTAEMHYILKAWREEQNETNHRA